jgi:hypothetical protein
MDEVGPPVSAAVYSLRSARTASVDSAALQEADGGSVASGHDWHGDIAGAVAKAVSLHTTSWTAALQASERELEARNTDALQRQAAFYEQQLVSARRTLELDKQVAVDGTDAALRSARAEAAQARQELASAAAESARLYSALEALRADSVPLSVHRMELLGKELSLAAREVAARDALRKSKLAADTAVSRAHALLRQSDERLMVQVAHRNLEVAEQLRALEARQTEDLLALEAEAEGRIQAAKEDAAAEVDLARSAAEAEVAAERARAAAEVAIAREAAAAEVEAANVAARAEIEIARSALGRLSSWQPGVASPTASPPRGASSAPRELDGSPRLEMPWDGQEAAAPRPAPPDTELVRLAASAMDGSAGQPWTGSEAGLSGGVEIEPTGGEESRATSLPLDTLRAALEAGAEAYQEERTVSALVAATAAASRQESEIAELTSSLASVRRELAAAVAERAAVATHERKWDERTKLLTAKCDAAVEAEKAQRARTEAMEGELAGARAAVEDAEGRALSLDVVRSSSAAELGRMRNELQDARTESAVLAQRLADVCGDQEDMEGRAAGARAIIAEAAAASALAQVAELQAAAAAVAAAAASEQKLSEAETAHALPVLQMVEEQEALRRQVAEGAARVEEAEARASGLQQQLRSALVAIADAEKRVAIREASLAAAKAEVLASTAAARATDASAAAAAMRSRLASALESSPVPSLGHRSATLALGSPLPSRATYGPGGGRAALPAGGLRAAPPPPPPL